MLSFPRDLYVELPGYGYDKINTAYPYGGPALCVETVGQLTGLPIHHFMEVDFDGFWNVVNILGGVYYPVDRRYYNPESSSWKSIDIEPGYQLLDGHDALDFVRFRHDARGDFSRMQRQQTFLKELQRQSGRWNKDWKRVTKLLTAITCRDHVRPRLAAALLPLASLALTLDTSDVNTVRLEGAMQMMNGLSYVVASPDEVQAAVAEFADPTQAPVVDRGGSMPKKAYTVRVFNGSGVTGVATTATDQLVGLGYQAEAAGNADSFDYGNSVVYAHAGHEGHRGAVRPAAVAGTAPHHPAGARRAQTASPWWSARPSTDRSTCRNRTRRRRRSPSPRGATTRRAGGHSTRRRRSSSRCPRCGARASSTTSSAPTISTPPTATRPRRRWSSGALRGRATSASR